MSVPRPLAVTSRHCLSSRRWGHRRILKLAFAGDWPRPDQWQLRLALIASARVMSAEQRRRAILSGWACRDAARPAPYPESSTRSTREATSPRPGQVA